MDPTSIRASRELYFSARTTSPLRILLLEVVEIRIPAVQRIEGREVTGPSFVLPASHAEYLVRELAKESGKRQEAAEKVVEAAEAEAAKAEAAEGFAAEAEASTSSTVDPAAEGAWWEVSGRW